MRVFKVGLMFKSRAYCKRTKILVVHAREARENISSGRARSARNETWLARTNVLLVSARSAQKYC
jgi:hypothetical protein